MAAKLIVVGSGSYGVCHVIMHLYWTKVLNNCPPLNNIATISIIFGALPGALTMVWFQYPAGLRKTKKFRKRYFRYVVYLIPVNLYVFIFKNLDVVLIYWFS